jgi:hypothetical protein
MGWMAGVRFPLGTREFSLVHSIQIISGAHPAPSSAEVKNDGAIPPLPHRDNFTFFFFLLFLVWYYVISVVDKTSLNKAKKNAFVELIYKEILYLKARKF